MSFAMTEAEQKQIDSRVEQMMDWAQTRQAEAEQLAMDSARLLSCTKDRLDIASRQGFFRRCWSRFSGEAGAVERANAADMIQMQKIAFRYVNMLQERELLMAHSMLALKNNLFSLAVREEETKDLVAKLAGNTLRRFEDLEKRVDQLEVSSNLQEWLQLLGERDYDEKIPTEFMRPFRVINDFYGIKNDGWTFKDLLYMRKAIRIVGINPKKKLSLNDFIDGLTDEIQDEEVGFDAYGKALDCYKPSGFRGYSQFVIDNISSPVFVSMHSLKQQYMDRLDVVEELRGELSISTGEALKRLIRRGIAQLNVDLDYEFPLAETAMEILGCLRLAKNLLKEKSSDKDSEKECVEDVRIKNIDADIKTDDEENIDTQNNNENNEVNTISHETILNTFLEPLANKDKDNFYLRKHSSNKDIARKIASGIKSFAPHIDIVDVIAYWDSTLFGGGEDGFILTDDTIYCKEAFSDPFSIDYAKILSVSEDGNNIVVSTDCDKKKILIVSDSIRKAIMLSLTAITNSSLVISTNSNKKKAFIEKTIMLPLSVITKKPHSRTKRKPIGASSGRR